MLLCFCLVEVPYDSNLRHVIVSHRVYIPSSDMRHILSASMILSSFIKRLVLTTIYTSSDVINLLHCPWHCLSDHLSIRQTCWQNPEDKLKSFRCRDVLQDLMTAADSHNRPPLSVSGGLQFNVRRSAHEPKPSEVLHAVISYNYAVMASSRAEKGSGW